MTKFELDKDEWYPVYSLRTPTEYSDQIIELTDEECREYSRVQKEFVTWQEKLSELDHDRTT